MAFVFGTTGLVTSWSGVFNSLLIATNQAPSKFTMNVVGDVKDTTRFSSATGGAIFKRNSKGLRSVSGTITSYINTTPRIGSTGLVTWAGPGYAAFLNEYALSIKAAMAETTLFNATAPEWRSYTPGLVEYSGSVAGFLDDATALPGTLLDAEPGSATFQIGSTKSLSGSVITTGVSVDVDPRNIIAFKSNFVGDGALTTAGAAAELWSADGATTTVTTPVPGTLTLQTDTGATYAGSAFYTSIDIKCKVDDILEITVGWQGTGAWTGFTGV